MLRRRSSISLAVLVAVLVAPALPARGSFAAAGAASPVDCVVPGIDDHCEKWAHRYTEGEGEAPFGRHTNNYGVAGAISRSGKLAFALGHRTDWPRTVRNEMQTVAYNVVTGEVVWVAHEAASDPNWHAYARAVVVSPDDTVVYSVGIVFEDPGSAADPRDILVAAYDADTGGRLWRTIYDGPGQIQDDVFAAAVAPAGDRLYLAAAVGVQEDPVFTFGSSQLYTSRRISTGGLEVDVDYGLLTLDGTSGDVLDEALHAGASFTIDGVRHGSWDLPTDMQVSRDGRRIVVAGLTSGRESYKALRSHSTVVVWDAEEGAGVGWKNAWARELPAVPLGMGFFEAGQVVAFAGTFGQGGTENNPYAVAGLDAGDGSVRWETRFSLLGLTNRVELPRGLLIDEQRGTVYVPGLSRYTGSSVGAAGALALRGSDGTVAWRKAMRDPRSEATIVFNYDSDEMPIGALDPFSGHLQLASDREGRIVTRSLDRATGAVRWAGIFDHPTREGPYLERSGADWLVDVEAAAGRTVAFGNSYIPNRDTCTTGMLTLPCARTDFLTIAYEV